MVRGAFSALSVLIVQPSNTPSEVSKVDLHSQLRGLTSGGGEIRTASPCPLAAGRGGGRSAKLVDGEPVDGAVRKAGVQRCGQRCELHPVRRRHDEPPWGRPVPLDVAVGQVVATAGERPVELLHRSDRWQKLPDRVEPAHLTGAHLAWL